MIQNTHIRLQLIKVVIKTDYIMKKLSIFFLITIILFQSCSKVNDVYTYGNNEDIDWTDAANKSTQSLINQFWNNAGYFNYGSNSSNTGFQYWPNAHAMDVIIDAYIRTKDDSYKALFNQWYTGIKVYNGNTYYNNYYDDMEWNALTMLRLYSVTSDEKYLTTVKELWSDIIKGWNDTYANGGIAWVKTALYSKNACSNGPASILSARLYNITKEEVYKDWAVKIYEWEKNTLFERGTGAIYDNINGQTNTVDETALTYNQGTFVGAAVELYNITADETYLNDAQKAANYTITKCINTSTNILRDEGVGDNALFKGIFMRYFLMLIQVKDLNASYKNKFITFFNNNAEVLWTKGCYQQELLFGSAWDTPPVGEAQLTAQASAGMMIEAKAAYELSK